MKCLSIRAPWSVAIGLGLKPVENRNWKTDYRGPLLIHSPKKYDLAGYAWLRHHGSVVGLGDAFADKIAEGAYPTGCIIGCAMMTGCVTEHPSDYFYGPYGFELESATLFPPDQVIPCRGQLGLFDVSPEVLVPGLSQINLWRLWVAAEMAQKFSIEIEDTLLGDSADLPTGYKKFLRKQFELYKKLRDCLPDRAW